MKCFLHLVPRYKDYSNNVRLLSDAVVTKVTTTRPSGAVEPGTIILETTFNVDTAIFEFPQLSIDLNPSNVGIPADQIVAELKEWTS